MPRRNRNVTNKRRHLASPRVPTSGWCSHGKERFSSERKAAEALKQARQNRTIHQALVTEERWYYHIECGGYHLTSKPDSRAPLNDGERVVYPVQDVTHGEA